MTYDQIRTCNDIEALADERRRLYPRLFGAPSARLTEAQNKYESAGARIKELQEAKCATTE